MTGATRSTVREDPCGSPPDDLAVRGVDVGRNGTPRRTRRLRSWRSRSAGSESSSTSATSAALGSQRCPGSITLTNG